MILRLQTLGAVGVRLLGEHVEDFFPPRPKPFALLTYIVVQLPGRPLRRDTLLPLFWPELDEPHARKALRQTLFHLGRDLGPDVVVRHGNEGLSTDPERLECDAVLFREALAEGRPERALDLYVGEFLEGFHVPGCAGFDRWAGRVRAALRSDAASAAWCLARSAHERRCRDGALDHARRAVELAPFSERGWRCLMRLLAAYDERAAALLEYERLVRILGDDLGVEPSAETRAVADGIRGCGPGPEDPWYLDREEEGPPRPGLGR